MSKKHRRNPLSSLKRAASSAFRKENMSKAIGIISGTIGTTILTDLALSPHWMSKIKDNKVLNVLSMFLMSGVAGLLAKQTKFTAKHAGDVAIGGAVAAVTRALKYVAGEHHWGTYLSGEDGMNAYMHIDQPLVGTHGFGAYAGPGTSMVSMHGLVNYATREQMANVYHMHGMSDCATLPQTMDPRLVHIDQSYPHMAGMAGPGGRSHGGSEDDITGAAIAGMGGMM